MGLYFQRVYSASENEIKSAVFTMNKVDSEIDDAPGLEDIGNLFPPSSSASPSPIANKRRLNVSFTSTNFLGGAGGASIPFSLEVIIDVATKFCLSSENPSKI